MAKKAAVKKEQAPVSIKQMLIEQNAINARLNAPQEADNGEKTTQAK